MTQQKLHPDETYEPATGDIINITRNNIRHQILYLDARVVVMRSEETSHDNKGNSTRLDSREHFETSVQTGYYEPRPDSDLDLTEDAETQDWTAVDYVGEQTNKALHDAGFETMLDLCQCDAAALLDVDGVGSSAVQNLIEYRQ